MFEGSSSLRGSLILLFLLIFLVAFFPILTPLFMTLVFISLNYDLKSKVFMTLLFSSCFFSIISLLKLPESDLVVYIEAISEISKYSFFDVLDFNYVSLRDTELLFNYYLWFLSTFDSAGLIFKFTSSMIIYSIVGYCLVHNTWNHQKFSLLLVVSMLLFSLTFSLTGHLIRQYIAASFLLLAITLNDPKNKYSYVLFLIPPLIHISMLPFCILLPLMMIFRRSLDDMKLLYLTVFFSLLVLTSINIYGFNFVSGVNKNDGSIPLFLIFFDLVLFLMFLFRKNKVDYSCRENKLLYYFSLVLLGCLISTSSMTLVFFRYYFMMDFLRGFFLLWIIYSFSFEFKSFSFVKFIALIFSFLFFLYRLNISNWKYGGTAIDILFNQNLTSLIERVSNV